MLTRSEAAAAQQPQLANNPSGTDNSNPGNFANRPKAEVQAIARQGGLASSSSAAGKNDVVADDDDKIKAAAAQGQGQKKGENVKLNNDVLGMADSPSGTQNTNPGNFANRTKADVQAAARLGGLTSGADAGGDSNNDAAQQGVDLNPNGTVSHGKGTQGFASMDPKQQAAIASKGGKSN